MNSIENPERSVHGLPDNWPCSCGCGEIVGKDDFVRVGEEFFLPEHEAKKFEREGEENERKLADDFSAEWPMAS